MLLETQRIHVYRHKDNPRPPPQSIDKMLEDIKRELIFG